MEIEREIQKFVADNFLFSGGVFSYDNDTSFLREGIIDSLGVMELVGFLESRFGIRPAPQEITPANFDSVNALAQFVRNKMVPMSGGNFDASGHVSL